MVETLCLITCALAIAQSGPTAEWPLAPRLSRGLELVYSGSCSEENNGPGVQFGQAYRLESRVFVLDISPHESQVAFFTVLKPRPARPGLGDKHIDPTSVRLQLGKVDPHGRVRATDAAALTVPLDGPPAIETGMFIELVQGRTRMGQQWEVAEDSRPPIMWNVTGTETVNGTTCLKLLGVQQSDDWDQPRADRTAWKRRDTLWVAPSLGIACRVERTIEQREPARRQPNRQLKTSYTLESQIVYPGQLSEDRCREILLACQLAQRAKPFLHEPEKAAPRFFDEMIGKIAYHLERQPATPYREGLLLVQKQLEATRRGEVTRTAPHETAGSITPVIALGQPAPDFLVPVLGARESARLHRYLGRPVLMVFYSPTSRHAVDILKFAQAVEADNRPDIRVLGLAVADDSERILKQRDELRLTFPLLSGQGLKLTYAVDATPKFVILDQAGVVRSTVVGWGQETPGILTEELNTWKRVAGRK
jgi:peroxiredoxin